MGDRWEIAFFDPFAQARLFWGGRSETIRTISMLQTKGTVPHPNNLLGPRPKSVPGPSNRWFLGTP